MSPLVTTARRCLLGLGLMASAATARAQSAAPSATVPTSHPAPLALTAIPATPAGESLRAWFDAFNSGDSTRLASYIARYGSDGPIGEQLRFRRQTGGFDLLSVERSEPGHLEFIVRERNSPMVAFGSLDRGAAPGDGPDLRALGPDMPASAAYVDAAERARVLARTAVLLDSFYVFPGSARRMADTIRARQARGAYDADRAGPLFARHLERDLLAVSHDKHLSMQFSATPLPPAFQEIDGRPVRTAEDEARERTVGERTNCSFARAERLEGNIGYLKVDGFQEPSVCAATAAAAMTFVGGTRALIIDLRENGGGRPPMVSLLASYLFDRRTHLNDLYTRYTNRTEQFFTSDSLAGRRYGAAKPVFVLTSANTFSGGEEFTNDLKELKRATIIGETTGGGAHPVRGRRIDDHFMLAVPFARAINPISHGNWEGAGVTPDVKVPAAEALDTALRMARALQQP